MSNEKEITKSSQNESKIAIPALPDGGWEMPKRKPARKVRESVVTIDTQIEAIPLKEKDFTSTLDGQAPPIVYREQKVTSSGIEKERISWPGYAYVKTGMLDVDQIVEYFTNLQKSAVARHAEMYGEEDNSYLQAEIEVDILKSKDTGKYGYSHCHITNDTHDNKMYWVFLGRGPKNDYPIEEYKDLPDGTTEKTVTNYIDPVWTGMSPEQIVEWAVFQENRYKNGKLTLLQIEDFRHCSTLATFLESWDRIAEDMKLMYGDELSEIITKNADFLGRVGNEIAFAEPLRDRDELERTFNEALGLLDGANIVEIINDQLIAVRERCLSTIAVNITAGKLYVENIGNDTNRSHLYIKNAPLWVTETVLKAKFTPFNTREGIYTREYPCLKGNKKVTGTYPHIWSEKNIDGLSNMWHIAYIDNGIPDAAFALKMRVKFDYLNVIDNVVQELVVFCWGDRDKYKNKNRKEGGGLSTSRQTDFAAGRSFSYHSGKGGNNSHKDNPSWVNNRVSGPPKLLPMNGKMFPQKQEDTSSSSSSEVAPVSVDIIANIVVKSTSEQPLVSQWGKSLNLDEFLIAEDGDRLVPVVITGHIKKIIGKRGYNPDLRDDGNFSDRIF